MTAQRLRRKKTLTKITGVGARTQSAIPLPGRIRTEWVCHGPSSQRQGPAENLLIPAAGWAMGPLGRIARAAPPGAGPEGLPDAPGLLPYRRAASHHQPSCQIRDDHGD